MPIENNSNYNYPITVAGPTYFTATATADTAAIAEETARKQAFAQAASKYGADTTQIVGQEEVKVRLNNDTVTYGSEVPTTYTATYTIQAEQIAPAKIPDPVPITVPPPVPAPADDIPEVVIVGPKPPPFVFPPEMLIQAPPIDIRIPIDPTGIDIGPEIPNRIQAQKPIVSDIPDTLPDIPIIQSSDPLTPPVIPGFDPFEPVGNSDINKYVPTPGLQAQKNDTVAQQTKQDANNANTQGDWRVRLSLAPGSKYLYNATPAGILSYLKATDGVIFPYVPQIQVTYAANYETADIVHSNYKMIQYKNSAVDQITITGDFTAQDTYEANYMLAVIHFFRSVTKMFYGRDQIPKPGTPPPLCYLSGLGEFQFDEHPLVISSFNYSLPNDVDYIRASSPTLLSGVDSTAYNPKGGNQAPGEIRLGQGDNPLNTGATKSPPKFRNYKATNTTPTYVPTKMSISITAFPMVTRNDISNNFSVKEYATGALLQGSRRNSGGIW